MDKRAILIQSRIRQIIEESGCNQGEISAMTESSQSQVNKWMRGTSLPGVLKLALLCSSLGVNPAWLLGLSERREL